MPSRRATLRRINGIHSAHEPQLWPKSLADVSRSLGAGVARVDDEQDREDDAEHSDDQVAPLQLALGDSGFVRVTASTNTPPPCSGRAERDIRGTVLLVERGVRTAR
jgi:hypothetical protein